MKVKEISLKNGDFNIWDDERIKKAFNFGNGTRQDFFEYMKNNKKYVRFEIIEY